MADITKIQPIGDTTQYTLGARYLTHTPNNTTTFLRGDNTWSNTLTGGFTATTLTASATYPNIRGNGTGVYFSIDGTWAANKGNVCIEANTLRPSADSSAAGMTLGTSAQPWGTIYGSSFTGNAASATKATQDGSGNVITSKYVTLDTTQTITGQKQFKALIQAYRYPNANNLPFMTFDKPGSYAAGIGPDGTGNRVKFGPCPLDGSAWTAEADFNSNNWYFQGSITGTSSLSISGAATISGGITSQHGHVFNVAGNEFNWIPDGYNSTMWFNYETFSRANNGTISEYICGNGKHGHANLRAAKVYNAVWNDIAETRKCKIKEAGSVVIETNTGEMISCNKKLAPGAKIISDTFGYLMGQINNENQAIAIAGRVLVKIDCDKTKFKLGMAVCSGPHGGIVPMKWYEKILWPERIIGTVSEIPNYDIWYGGKILADSIDKKIEPFEGDPIPVNGRIWIYVK